MFNDNLHFLFIGLFKNINKKMYNSIGNKPDQTLAKSIFSLINVCLTEFPSLFRAPSELILSAILNAFLDYKKNSPEDKKTSVNFLAVLFQSQKEFVAENCSVFTEILFLSGFGYLDGFDERDNLARKWQIIYRFFHK